MDNLSCKKISSSENQEFEQYQVLPKPTEPANTSDLLDKLKGETSSDGINHSDVENLNGALENQGLTKSNEPCKEEITQPNEGLCNQISFDENQDHKQYHPTIGPCQEESLTIDEGSCKQISSDDHQDLEHQQPCNPVNSTNIPGKANVDMCTDKSISNNSKKHSNKSDLCDILKNQNFTKSDGPNLKEKLKSEEGSNKFGKIYKKLIVLLGNGKNLVLTIPEIAEELLLRNYPELIGFDGSQKCVIFIPEWYLAKAVRYVDPSRGPELQQYSEQSANLCPERRMYFEDLKKFYMGGQRTYGGEVPERNLYVALQTIFNSINDSVAVFHGIDILKMNLEKFKVNEKDFVIINVTRKCIIVIEVKKTLGAGDSIGKSIYQLREAKGDLEAWFSTEGLHNWVFIPMIYTEAIEPSIDCDKCSQYIIEGMKNGFTIQL